MLTLALDTSTDKGSIAIMDGKKLMGAVFFTQKRSYSQILIPSIDFLLNHHLLSIGDIEGFSVSVGPGSFTGIRIGISCVKALSQAMNKKIAPISSLKALAYKLVDKENSLICSAIDAKKGEIFGGLFFCKGGALETIIEEGCYKPAEFFGNLPKEKIYFLGNAVSQFRKEIEEFFSGEPLFPYFHSFIAEEVGRLGYEILISGKGKSHSEIIPFYLRPSEAEMKRKIKESNP